MTNKGFILVEIVIVVGILAVLLTITLVAINPTQQFAQANNTKRRSDIQAILNAINEYQVNNLGQLPTGIDNTVQTLSSTDLNICTDLVSEYLSALPVDPQTNNGTPVTNCGAAYDTNYTVQSGASNRVTVTAPAAQNGETISATR